VKTHPTRRIITAAPETQHVGLLQRYTPNYTIPAAISPLPVTLPRIITGTQTLGNEWGTSPKLRKALSICRRGPRRPGEGNFPAAYRPLRQSRLQQQQMLG